MGVFKKQGVSWIDYYVNGHPKRERIGPDKRLAETVLRKRSAEIAGGSPRRSMGKIYQGSEAYHPERRIESNPGMSTSGC
jgi:hypothetical protein